MQATRLLRNFVSKQISRRSYTEGHSVTTINDLPSPQGSWKTHYDAKQRKYNAQLVAGIAAVIGTIIVGKAAGFVDGHNDIPERPADIPSYK